tara:strand:+ start:514 stop:786 length:273 start_codon:yes stop_codon:yes gene_type:complete
MEWINFKEKRPEENQIVWAMEKDHKSPVMLHFAYTTDDETDQLCYVWAMVYDVPWYNREKEKWEGDAEYDDEYTVTHWMPLPEPIKELSN